MLHEIAFGFENKKNNKNFQCKWNTIDTLIIGPYISIERMDAFHFTNAYKSSRLVAIYSQPTNHSKFIYFEGIAAGVSWDVYMLATIICCLLVGLFAFIEHMRPFHSEFCFWNVTIAILPCFNGQAPGFEHANSLARCVAIIVTSIFVFLCTTYYQTLLLSIHETSAVFALKVE
jgi:hypothetical protein